MTQETVFSNAQLVLPNEVITGSVVVRDGLIRSVDTGSTMCRTAQDCDGDYLAPGLIELHTDNLERHMVPRPKVDWPHRAAIIAHDREMVSAGITTVYDAIRVGAIVSDTRKRYGRYARAMADEILSTRAAGVLKVSHHLHLRAEVCSETLLDELDEFGPEDRVGIVSLMDHTPGQRQFSDLKKYEDYVCGKNGLPREGFADYVAFLRGLQSKLGAAHQEATVVAAKRYGATLASHDDTTAAQVSTSHEHGVKIAEFPTTVEAAQACRTVGIATILGAPNLVRGASHSGNVAAHDLAQQGLLDMLSSDYVPAALLLGAVQLGALWSDLARGMATVTSAPAAAVELTDRGVIAPGRRADLIRFSVFDAVPVLNSVWVMGARVG